MTACKYCKKEFNINNDVKTLENDKVYFVCNRGLLWNFVLSFIGNINTTNYKMWYESAIEDVKKGICINCAMKYNKYWIDDDEDLKINYSH